MEVSCSFPLIGAHQYLIAPVILQTIQQARAAFAQPTPLWAMARRWSKRSLPYLALVAIVSLTWCTVHRRWSRSAWKTPIVYLNDGTIELALAKALATGEIKPVLPKYPAHLGAPFTANWNDFPSIEEPLYAGQALLVRLFGLFLGSNLTVLLAHILAAVSFYALARLLRYGMIWSLVGGILFGLAPYAFARSLPHINLTYYWHIPWGLLVAWWCASAVVLTRRMVAMSILIAIVHGSLSIYYSNLFVQFLFGAMAICILRRQSWLRIVFPVALMAVVAVTLLVMNIDTLYHRMVAGPNPLAVVRIYAGLEIYALRPIELILPATHRLSALQDWAWRVYYSQTILHGETGSPYLGLAGIATMAWLAITAFANAIRGQTRILWHAWGIAWICLFSVVGGINGFIGTIGLQLFRCTNRFSIYILALLLLFGVRELSRLTRSWHVAVTGAFAAFVAFVGIWDQTPPATSDRDIRAVRAVSLADRKFVGVLESRLSPGAMIFELPVVPFPESPPINRMQDYEHFRPYLYSHSLRFSYGSVKGREQEQWQSEVLDLGVPMLIRSVERYGFSAVLINKKAYADSGTSLLSAFRNAGRSAIVAESDDLVCLSLIPDPHPSLPPYFDSNWYGLEGTAEQHWRWSLGDASIVVFNNAQETKPISIRFGLAAVKPRRVDLYDGSNLIYSADLTPGHLSESNITVPVTLQPGKTKLRFHTDAPPAPPENGDSRPLAFQITNFDTIE